MSMADDHTRPHGKLLPEQEFCLSLVGEVIRRLGGRANRLPIGRLGRESILEPYACLDPAEDDEGDYSVFDILAPPARRKLRRLRNPGPQTDTLHSVTLLRSGLPQL